MTETLMQIQAVTPGINFTLANLLTIGGGVVATLSTFFKLKYDQKSHCESTHVRFETMEREYEKENKLLREELLFLKGNKKAQKVEFMEIIKEKDEATRSRIDRTQQDVRDLNTATTNEFKLINTNISEIKSGNARIEGMLSQIISNKK